MCQYFPSRCICRYVRDRTGHSQYWLRLGDDSWTNSRFGAPAPAWPLAAMEMFAFCEACYSPRWMCERAESVRVCVCERTCRDLAFKNHTRVTVVMGQAYSFWGASLLLTTRLALRQWSMTYYHQSSIWTLPHFSPSCYLYGRASMDPPFFFSL